MFNFHQRALLKIKISRLRRKSVQWIKDRFNGKKPVKQPMFDDEEIIMEVPEEDTRDKVKKYKSTALIAVIGLAIGIHHGTTIPSKFGKVWPKRDIMIGAVLCSFAMSYVWYNYVETAYEGVSEDDISMMLDFVSHTNINHIGDKEDTLRTLDIVHHVITGEDFENRNKPSWKAEPDEEEEESPLDPEDDARAQEDSKSFNLPEGNIFEGEQKAKPRTFRDVMGTRKPFKYEDEEDEIPRHHRKRRNGVPRPKSKRFEISELNEEEMEVERKKFVSGFEGLPRRPHGGSKLTEEDREQLTKEVREGWLDLS